MPFEDLLRSATPSEKETSESKIKNRLNELIRKYNDQTELLASTRVSCEALSKQNVALETEFVLFKDSSERRQAAMHEDLMSVIERLERLEGLPPRNAPVVDLLKFDDAPSVADTPSAINAPSAIDAIPDKPIVTVEDVKE